MPKSLKFFLKILMVLGLIIRLWHYKDIPYPPSGDEVAFGYYGWSLLNFGTDEFGNKLPIYFPSIGDYKYPLLAYLNILPAAIFGLSDITIRFWSIMTGTLLIGSGSYLAYLLWKKSGPAIATGVVIMIMPWTLIMSRASYEANIALFLISVWLIIYQLRQQKRISQNTFFYSFSALSILIMYCYSATRIILPTTALFFWLTRNKDNKDDNLGKIFILITLIGLTSFIPWQSRARAEGALLRLTPDDERVLEWSHIEAGLSPLKPPVIWTRLMHNKYGVMALNFAKEYGNYFSQEFLFFDGKANNEAIPGIGVLLFAQLILLPIGLVAAAKNDGSKPLYIFLVAAPIAAAMTGNGPNLIRSSFMSLPLALFSGYGWWVSGEIFKTKLAKAFIWFGLGTLVLVSSLFALNQYFVHKATSRPWRTSQGTVELYREIGKLQHSYSAVVLPDDNYIYHLFYNKVSPVEFMDKATVLPSTRQDHWDRVEKFDKLIFKMAFECPKAGKLKVLYVCVGTNIPQNAKIIKVIRFADGLPHYTLLEFRPYEEADKDPQNLPDRLHFMIDRDGRYQQGYIPDSESNYW